MAQHIPYKFLHRLPERVQISLPVCVRSSTQPGRAPTQQSVGLCSLGHQDLPQSRACQPLPPAAGRQSKLAERKGKRKLCICVIPYLFRYLAHTSHVSFLCISYSCQHNFWGKLGQLHLDMLVKLQVSYFVSLNSLNLRLFLSLASKLLHLPDLWNQQHRLPFFVSKFFCTGHCQKYNAGLVGRLT